jgi:hypothetical protein
VPNLEVRVSKKKKTPEGEMIYTEKDASVEETKKKEEKEKEKENEKEEEMEAVPPPSLGPAFPGLAAVRPMNRLLFVERPTGSLASRGKEAASANKPPRPPAPPVKVGDKLQPELMVRREKELSADVRTTVDAAVEAAR